MNEFKRTIKSVVNNDAIKSCKVDRIKEIDEKISENIARTLFYMSEKSDDIEERRQILDRMLNINEIFRRGFDQEIQVLKDREQRTKGR